MTTLTLETMTYSFDQLNPDVLFFAISYYCNHMNCKGLEEQVELFLTSKAGKKIQFNSEGRIILHKVSR